MFLKLLLFDWLAYLSHSGKIYSCKCKLRTLYWLFGTFLLFSAGALSPSSFEPSSLKSSFFFFFDRTLAANASLCRCTGALSPLKIELKKTHVDDQCAVQTDSNKTCNISSAPLNSDGLERRISGKAPRPRGWIYSQTRLTGPRTANSLASWTDKDCHASCAITFGPHRRCPLWKKVWSPTCPLNGSFQSPNCPLKGYFHSPTGIF